MPETQDPSSQRGHVYAIDQEHRLVYIDQQARRVFPHARLGSLCYTTMRDTDAPCTDCPLNDLGDEVTCQSVIYSMRLDRWFEITCSRIDWPGHGTCTLFASQPAGDHGRNLFYSFSQPSSYDELFEINVSGNSYKILYHEPDKFVVPALEGRLDCMFQEVLDDMIDPDDRERFADFWDFDTLLERIGHEGGSLRGEFRKKRTDGAWCWVAQTVVPVKRGIGGETVVMCFIADIDDIKRADLSRLAEDGDIQQLVEKDLLTNLYNATTFYERAEEQVAASPDTAYEVVYVDIEHFKIFNEWHGWDKGDDLLRALGEQLGGLAKQHGGVAGYLGGGDFALLLPRGTVTERCVEKELAKPPFDSEDTIGFLPSIGVCSLDETNPSVLTACDHAMIAMTAIKGVYAKRVSWYESSMALRLENDTKVLFEVKQALKNHEFTLYWQPQCSTHTGKIVGLEALVRWRHPTRGLVLPSAFVPVMERNGFIASLDLYVWEEACRCLREWQDEDRVILPISVNISRADLYAVDVVEVLEDLVTRYGIDRRLLELEITESAYVEDEKVAAAVNCLKARGFTLLMDDFGSGYSSLNMLKDIAVDIIKIDMGFLRREENPRHSESILEAIVSMARILKLRVIAEGAETKEQVDFLKNVGCDYAQGYYFYRPMPIEDLRTVLGDGSVVDPRGVLSAQMDAIDLSTMLSRDEISHSVLERILGGLAIYAVYDDHFELLQVSNAYYRVTGCNPVDLKERQACIWRQIHPDDLPLVLERFDEAERHPIDGAEYVVRRYRLSGELMWIKARLFFLSRQEGHRLFFASIEDVTEQHRPA